MNWKFDSNLKTDLLKAINAIDEIYRRGYECFEEAKAARWTLQQLIDSEGKEKPVKFNFDDFYW